MVERTYGTTVIPGDEITILSGGTIAVSTAFSRTVALVGGMDTDDEDGGDATPGEVQKFSSQSEAETLFGEDSELYTQARLAIQNRAREVYAIAVEETEVEAETLDTDGELENAPIFNPEFHPEHEIVVMDGSDEIDYELVYDDDEVEDAGEDEVILNPITGTYDADSADYEIDYAYGDYEAAIEEIAGEGARITAVLTESEELANHVNTELEDVAEDFVFSHGISGIPLDSESDYEHDIDAPRHSLIAPAAGYTDDAQEEKARLAGAVAGLLASKPLGSSTTYDSLAGFTGLVDEYRPSEAGELIDNRIMPVIDDGRIFVVKDMTTAEDSRFERVYANEVADEVAELSHLINQDFIGENNTDEIREDLAESHRTFLREMTDDRPPLLDDYSLEVETADDDEDAVEIEIGVDIVNVIDAINVKIIVGDVITNGGTN